MSRKLTKISEYCLENSSSTSTAATSYFLNSQPLVIVGDSNGCGTVFWNNEEVNQRGIFQTSSSEVSSVDFSMVTRSIVSGNARGSIFLHDLGTLKNTETYNRHSANVLTLQATSRGLILSGSLDTTIRVWDERQKSEVMMLKGHTGGVLSLKVSPDDQWIASASEDGSVRIWDLSTSKTLASFAGPDLKPLCCVAFNPEEIQIAVAGLGRRSLLVDLEAFTECGMTSFAPSAICCLAFDAKGTSLYLAGNNFLRAISPRNLQEYTSIDASWKAPQKILFNEEGDLFAIAKTSTGASLFSIAASEGCAQKPLNDHTKTFNETEDILCARKSHGKIVDILEKKISDITQVVNVWFLQSNQHYTHEVIDKINDSKVIADIYNMILQNSIMANISIELADTLLSKIKIILEVKYKFFIKIGLNFAIEVLKTFGRDIKNAKSQNFLTKIDLAREERLKNYDALLATMQDVSKNLIFNKIRTQYKHEEIGLLAQKYISELELLLNSL